MARCRTSREDPDAAIRIGEVIEQDMVKDFGLQAAIDGLGIAFVTELMLTPHLAAGPTGAVARALVGPVSGVFSVLSGPATDGSATAGLHRFGSLASKGIRGLRNGRRTTGELAGALNGILNNADSSASPLAGSRA